MKKCALGFALVLFVSFAFAQYNPYAGDYAYPYGDYPPPPRHGDYGSPQHGNYAPAPQPPQHGGYAPPQHGGYAPAQHGNYVPAPQPPHGNYAPAPQPPHGGYAPAQQPQHGGYAPPPHGNYVPAPQPPRHGDYAPPRHGDYGPPPPPRGDYAPPPRVEDRHSHSEDYDSLGIYFSLNFPFPVQWESFSDDNGISSALTFGWAVGVDLTALFTKRLGFHLSADFCLPQIQTAFYEGLGGSLVSDTYYMSDYWQESWGVSLFVGPTLALARTNRVLFAVSPGVHIAAFIGDTWGYSTSRLLVGLGGSAELALNLTRSLFIRAAVDVTYDFVGVDTYSSRDWHGSTYTTEESGDVSILNIVPSIGVGFRL